MPVYSEDPKDPRTLSVVEAAYLAGILDGEGTISLRRASREHKDGTPYVVAVVEVANTNVVLLEWIQRTTGCGAIYTHGIRVSGQKAAYKIGWNQIQIRAILPQVFPFLVIKRDQALLVLEHVHDHSDWQIALDRKERVNGLNQRGSVGEIELQNENGTCPICGGLVDRSRYARKTYCSEKCQQDAYNAQRPRETLPVVKKTCEHCGSEFETSRPEARYCSSNCRNAAHIVRKRKGEGLKPRDIALTCEHCGEKFLTARADAKYCSHRCRIAGWRVSKKTEGV